ncbi:uncharacterized protein STEHIDRAFT_150440, partial [Stereum hirsutum FP-91666 SS1]|uniref:uncharacterized protein n=1 Tax=Stereum hirsutum (strain FP-91666) TaxID=721885 RepID=UPI0004449D29
RHFTRSPWRIVRPDRHSRVFPQAATQPDSFGPSLLLFFLFGGTYGLREGSSRLVRREIQGARAKAEFTFSLSFSCFATFDG